MRLISFAHFSINQVHKFERLSYQLTTLKNSLKYCAFTISYQKLITSGSLSADNNTVYNNEPAKKQRSFFRPSAFLRVLYRYVSLQAGARTTARQDRRRGPLFNSPHLSDIDIGRRQNRRNLRAMTRAYWNVYTRCHNYT